MNVLLTGGLGYIGSHVALKLLDNNQEVVIVDNLSNSKLSVLESIKKISSKNVSFYNIDVTEYEELKKVFSENKIDCIIHFAGYKSVNESLKKPLMYYQNNIDSILNVLKLAKEFNVNKMIFSSSATVYDPKFPAPYDENSPLGAVTPYGETKLINEKIISDLCCSDKDFKAISLRYFNPIGAHESGLIGEDPNGIPNNLMPYITRVAVGKLDKLTVYGSDYDTKDGTCERDFIHIDDLASAHYQALLFIDKLQNNYEAINIGTGKGVSVKEVLDTFNRISNNSVKYTFGERRAGDIPISYAKVEKAKKLLNFSCKKTLEDMCKSAYNYEKLSLLKQKETN